MARDVTQKSRPRPGHGKTTDWIGLPDATSVTDDRRWLVERLAEVFEVGAP